MLSKKVQAFIRQHNLLSSEGKHLVALSGGADSVALLLLLQELGYEIEAVHCNFHLRGDESDRDEKFCIDFCKEKDIPIHLAHFDTLSYAQLHKVSIEMAARDLRYGYFEQLRKDLNAATICVAHHKEDSVETVLLNLIRGTGIDGLTGISPRNGYIVRPLLDVSREEIEQYLQVKGQKYVTDSSNLKDDVKRNKVRLHLIPMLQTINPSVIDNIHQTSKYLAEARDILYHDISLRYPKGNICIETLQKEASPEFVLWFLIKDYGFLPNQVEEIVASLNGLSGKEWRSSTHILVKDRKELVIEPLMEQTIKEMKIPETGNYRLGDSLFCITMSQLSEITLDKSNNVAMLDADKVPFPLTIRLARQGDVFMPFGMRQKKLVSDFLTDRKLNILQKRRQLVVTENNGNIVWLVNERPDNRYCITPSTQRVLIIKRLS